MFDKKILLIITGGIAAYKSLDLIRRLRDSGAEVHCILTKGGAEFITPLAVSALSGKQTYTDLFSLKDEVEMGHIRLSRECDLIVVAPCTAEMIAKIAHGRADDLASTTILASNKPVAIAPSMNTEMWLNAATQDNLKTIYARSVHQIGPASGDLACGEVGCGRMAEVSEIAAWCEEFFKNSGRLSGKRILVTAGPTREAIDSVRFLSNRSSGKQGYEIATACAMAGAEVVLVSGPTDLRPPANCKTIMVECANDMASVCQDQLPADVAICTAAVSDWQSAAPSRQKLKKQAGQSILDLQLTQTPDILKSIANSNNRRPQLVIGFAAESENLIANAQNKLRDKNCDWILANDIGKNPGIMGGDDNQLSLITASGVENWPMMSKREVAGKLVGKITKFLVPSA